MVAMLYNGKVTSLAPRNDGLADSVSLQNLYGYFRSSKFHWRPCTFCTDAAALQGLRVRPDGLKS